MEFNVKKPLAYTQLTKSFHYVLFSLYYYYHRIVSYKVQQQYMRILSFILLYENIQVFENRNKCYIYVLRLSYIRVARVLREYGIRFERKLFTLKCY